MRLIANSLHHGPTIRQVNRRHFTFQGKFAFTKRNFYSSDTATKSEHMKCNNASYDVMVAIYYEVQEGVFYPVRLSVAFREEDRVDVMEGTCRDIQRQVNAISPEHVASMVRNCIERPPYLW